jgi:hypothetical protein
MSDAVILVVALGFGAMGLLALVRPADVLAQFGVVVDTVDGRNEVRAVYGGFGLAIAALLGVAALGNPSTAEGIVVTVAVSLLGMAAGRLLSALRERPTGLYPVWIYFAIEIVSAAALLLTI